MFTLTLAGTHTFTNCIYELCLLWFIGNVLVLIDSIKKFNDMSNLLPDLVVLVSHNMSLTMYYTIIILTLKQAMYYYTWYMIYES